ncbi:MAG: Tim44/TimA family putative adaptor protein [Alphaproteobacteria bacterium]
MNGSDSIFTIIFLALAVVIFLRLRSVLGRRTGNERQPFDPYSRPDQSPDMGDKVISLPPRQGYDADVTPRTDGQAPVDLDALIEPVADPKSPLGSSLKELIRQDPSFEPKGFVDGAKMAYEMIVTAFAEGDRRALRQLLSREVYDGFVSAIAERESREETIEFKFIGVEKANITETSIQGPAAHLTIRFVSELISATRNKAGDTVDGDPSTVSEVTDIWTFSREVAARDPNWRLVATESVE